MPIYEYRCADCGRKSTILFRSFSQTVEPSCGYCGSANMRKLVSRFSVGKSEEGRLDDIADRSKFADIDENDPRSMARWARKMSQELGEELGDDFEEMVDRMEAGEMPEDEGMTSLADDLPV